MAFFFIQMTDPQFGMFASLSGMDESRILDFRQRLGWKIRPSPKITGFADETILYEKAIAAANRLNPAFVMVSGDMVQDYDQPDQLAELRRITAQLNSNIPIYWAPGNWDVGNRPTPESLSRYRGHFGDDNYSFEYADTSFIVLNSSVGFDDSQVPQEWDHQIDFLRSTLAEARGEEAGGNGRSHIVVFLHHPLYAQEPEEDDTWAVISRDKRKLMLELFEEYRVSVLFHGHWHRCYYLDHKGMQMVTTGPVGYPLGDDPSGLRIVKVYQDRIEHQYYGLDAVPDEVDL